MTQTELLRFKKLEALREQIKLLKNEVSELEQQICHDARRPGCKMCIDGYTYHPYSDTEWRRCQYCND